MFTVTLVIICIQLSSFPAEHNVFTFEVVIFVISFRSNLAILHTSWLLKVCPELEALCTWAFNMIPIDRKNIQGISERSVMQSFLRCLLHSPGVEHLQAAPPRNDCLSLGQEPPTLLTNRKWLLIPAVVRIGLSYTYLMPAIFALSGYFPRSYLVLSRVYFPNITNAAYLQVTFVSEGSSLSPLVAYSL